MQALFPDRGVSAPHVETFCSWFSGQLRIHIEVAVVPGLFTSVRFLTTAIASEMSYAAYGSLQRNALYSIGLVLFLFIMLINVLLNVFIKNKKED